MAGKKKVILVHLVPRESAGGIVDARHVLKNLITSNSESHVEYIIVTNDRDLLTTINPSTRQNIRVIYIDFIPYFNEIFKLAPIVWLSVLRLVLLNRSAVKTVFLLEEYPQIIMPIILLVSILSRTTSIIVKLHSISYIKYYIKYVIKTIDKTIIRILLPLISKTFTLLLKNVSAIIMPNPFIAKKLREKNIRTIYIPPGNFIDYKYIENIIRKCGNETKYGVLFVSSKITTKDILILSKTLRLQAQDNNIRYKYAIIGRPSTYDYHRTLKLLEIIKKYLRNNIIIKVSIEGVPRDIVLCEMAKSDTTMTTGYLDTWSYTLFEASITSRISLYIAQNMLTYNMLMSLISKLDLKSIHLYLYDDNRKKIIVKLKDTSASMQHLHYWFKVYEKYNELYIYSIKKLIAILASK